MANDVNKVLVIGGGFSGMVAAISMQRKGMDVDLIEISEDWRREGAGISLGGSTMRLFDQLGLMDDFKRIGAAHAGIHIRGPEDQLFAELPTPGLAPGVPGVGGAMRPAMGKMLSDKVLEAGVNVRLGTTYTDLDIDGGSVTFSDGSTETYDLIVAADGFWSKTRDRMFPDAPKAKYVKQAVWRAVVERPEHLPTVSMWMGPKLKAGINHVSATHSYLFLTEDRAEMTPAKPDTFVPDLKALLKKFPSPTLQKVAEEIGDHSQIDYRPLENLILPKPWHRGRVVLIGDAVHATTPHLASGALMGMEDGYVLAEELADKATRDEALTAFEDRRYERCRMVVENSGRLAEIEIEGGSQEEHGQLMRESNMALAQPI
ncbi:MAG: FAD-dependent oxidoreductase [Pseudomonadota bacterium]|nr:FAD-dependent oxidoreductase [Pseudomonadota bacterium]